MQPVSTSKFTYKSDIPKPSLATTPTGILHATRPSPHRSEHCFAYLSDITYAENVVGHLLKYGFARGNIAFIPYSSKENWCRMYPHAVPHVECDEGGNVTGYPFFYHDVDNVGEVSLEERECASGEGSGERGSGKKINRKGPKLFKGGELFDLERDELHKEIYSYFHWLERQLSVMQEADEGSLASRSGINVNGFKMLMAGMKSTFKVCRKWNTSNNQHSELPLLEQQQHLGEELHHRAIASQTRKHNNKISGTPQRTPKSPSTDAPANDYANDVKARPRFGAIPQKTDSTSESSCCENKASETICCSESTCNKLVPASSRCTNPTQNHLTCLALIRPCNTAVLVFDAAGRSRAFRSSNPLLNAQLRSNQLCFSSHDAGTNADGMLTHCFDQKGEHGVPLEDCVCGRQEPHIHAHVHNPSVCDENTAKKRRADWRYLSQITLELDESDKDSSGRNKSKEMPINPSMPKQCISSALKQHLDEKGLRIVPRECCHDPAEECREHRKYGVWHGDHEDYLIHDEKTKGLHLEHPCGACGENDVHGRFRWMHTRSWLDDSNAEAGARGKEGRGEIRFHFFREPQEPFRLLEAIAHLFELESSRVHAAVRVVDDLVSGSAVSAVEGSRVGRSHLFVEKICCASESRQIESLLGKVAGVFEVSVNTTTKIVYVDHDVDVISAIGIAEILNEQRFGARVKKDSASEMAALSGIPTDVHVVSKFHLPYDLRMTETNDRTTTLDVIEACLREKFSNDDQIREIMVDSSKEVLIVEHNPYYLTASAIANALDSYGYEVNIDCDGGADGLWALPSVESTKDTIEDQKSSVRATVILSGVFWIVSMFSMIGGNWEYLKYVAILSVAFGLPPIAMKAFATLRRFHFDVNCMMLFAVLGALALQEFTEAAAVTFLFAISEALESKCTSRARNALADIICLRPEHANVINPITQDVVVLPATSVAVGSLVRVKTGDKVPCDGVVVEGKSTIDESTLTGESRPVSKSEGMVVSGGTINTGSGMLVVKTTATSDNSAVSRLIRLVEEAQINRSDTEKMVDQIAKVYTPIIVLMAVCMATIPWAFGTETGQFWAKNALITIVIACPCSLVISTPVVYVAGLTAAAQRGVIVKGGQHLESLGKVKSISFDKTGTLSEGVFQLLHFKEIGKRDRKEVFAYLALMEKPASHPLSDAIVQGAASEQVNIPTNLEMKNHTLLPGEGITASVGDKCVYVGNKKLFQRIGLYDHLPSELASLVEDWSNAGGTTGFISIEGEGIVGTYCVSDKIRGEAKCVVNDLKKMGIEITMLTGDLRPAAIAIGVEIGLEEERIKSELLPKDKLDEIGKKVKEHKDKYKWWRSKQTVLMCGDGVNDAPALALADVSVAMGEGSSLAMETADITLLDSSLNKLFYIVCMGRRVIRTIIENIIFSIFFKVLVVCLLFAGYGSLWLAIAADVGAMILVTLNGMKLLPSSKKEIDLMATNARKSDDVKV